MEVLLVQYPLLLLGTMAMLALAALLFWLRSISKKRIQKSALPQAKDPAAEITALKKQASPARSLEDMLSKTRQGFWGKVESLLGTHGNYDSNFRDELEVVLYSNDLGPRTAEKLLEKIKSDFDSSGKPFTVSNVKDSMASEVRSILLTAKLPEATQNPLRVILIVGVNGAGKTTSIGKLAYRMAGEGKKVLMAAGDTFRAAAGSQLSVWSERAGVDIFQSEATKDPAAIAYEAVQLAVAKKYDVAIIDTAGRLHTQVHLMDELKKVKRVVEKALPGAPHEILLVVDANTGQNALHQAKQFNEALGLSGLIVSKLDGTAKGGVVVGIAHELGLGVRYVGVGEGLEDLRDFSAEEFARGLFS